MHQYLLNCNFGRYFCLSKWGHLEKLQLSNFRNYENQFFEFSKGLNCILGKNGSGKTNLLDAVYFLALTKSSIHSQDQLSIKFEEDFMLIEAVFINDLNNAELITCSYNRGSKKHFLQDKKPYERISDHIGKYPVVLIAPDDTDLIRDASETRRKLFDGILAQINPEYLKTYQKYNRTLDQRNAILKQFAEHNYFDEDLIQIYSTKLLDLGQTIFEIRKAFIESFLDVFNKHYTAISESSESVSIAYLSEVSDPNFSQIFKNALANDLQAQRTTKGIHKDDYSFLMNQNSIKKFGSQGQKKSFIMAIRLAQFEILETTKGYKPILLLDDIFDKLDETRIKKLVEMINDGIFGQIFLTDARPNRTKELMKNLNVDYKNIDIT